MRFPRFEQLFVKWEKTPILFGHVSCLLSPSHRLLPHGCQAVPEVLERVSLARGQSDFTNTILSVCYKVSISNHDHASLKTQKEVLPLIF